MSKLNEEFLFNIFEIVREIPKGKVATYGLIAKLSGYEKNSRLVGKALSISEYFGKFPCHRVVNSSGRLAPHFKNQRRFLLEENIVFKENGNVDLKKCLWDIKY